MFTGSRSFWTSISFYNCRCFNYIMSCTCTPYACMASEPTIDLLSVYQGIIHEAS